MKNTKRILITLVLAVVMLLTMASISAFAEGSTVVFLTPNSNWKADNARFAIYVWDDSGSTKWIDMTDSNGDGVYEGVIPEGYTNLIFCRMDPNQATNGWSKTWNQTEDLTLPTDGNNHYRIKSGTWDKGGGEWSYFESAICIHTPSGEGSVISSATCTESGEISHTCSKCGESYKETVKPTGHNYNEFSICDICGKEVIYIIAGNIMKADGAYRDGDNSTLFVSEWDIEDENNRMEYDPDAELYVKIYKNVAAGEYHFKVVENKSWDTSYGQDGENCYLKVDKDGSTVTITFQDGKISVASALPTAPGHSDKDEENKAPDNSESPDNENDGSQNKPQEQEEKLNFFQKIWRAIVNFFKNLFGGKKK